MSIIDVYQGVELDEVGQLWDFPRAYTASGRESDEEYRAALRNHIPTCIRGKPAKKPTCECGSEKAKSIGHSHWCPKWEQA
jgi:hypothetical protein